MKTTQIGLDLAKSVVEVAVSHQPGRVHARHRLPRARVRRFFADHAPAEVLMEAGSSAHHWGQELQALGHRVALLPRGTSPATATGTRPIARTPRPCSKPPATRPSTACP